MLVATDNRTENREVLKDPKSHKTCRAAITMLVRVKNNTNVSLPGDTHLLAQHLG